MASADVTVGYMYMYTYIHAHGGICQVFLHTFSAWGPQCCSSMLCRVTTRMAALCYMYIHVHAWDLKDKNKLQNMMDKITSTLTDRQLNIIYNMCMIHAYMYISYTLYTYTGTYFFRFLILSGWPSPEKAWNAPEPSSCVGEKGEV